MWSGERHSFPRPHDDDERRLPGRPKRAFLRQWIQIITGNSNHKQHLLCQWKRLIDKHTISFCLPLPILSPKPAREEKHFRNCLIDARLKRGLVDIKMNLFAHGKQNTAEIPMIQLCHTTHTHTQIPEKAEENSIKDNSSCFPRVSRV